MKSQTKMAIKVFGGAAAAVAVGLGGVGVNQMGSTPTTGHSSSSVIPAPAASGSSTGTGSGVHIATLASFDTPRTCVVEHRSEQTGRVWYTPAPCK